MKDYQKKEVDEDNKSIVINKGNNEGIVSRAENDVFARYQLEDAEGDAAYRFLSISNDDEVNFVVSKLDHFGKIDDFWLKLTLSKSNIYRQ